MFGPAIPSRLKFRFFLNANLCTYTTRMSYLKDAVTLISLFSLAVTSS